MGRSALARWLQSGQAMNVKLISCWFATSYGAYTDGLRRALERRLGREVGVVATNCGCGDPAAERREMWDDRCQYFERPNINYFKSSNPVKYWLRTQVRQVACWERARQFHRYHGDAEVIHFQQILNATGSVTAFNWLNQPSRAARVVTVHELDPHQLDFPDSSRQYNLADRVIVHCQDMKDALIARGVDGARIDVVQHGVEIRSLPTGPREGIVFYGGHKLPSGKGFDTLVHALALVKQRLGDRTPTVQVHGHWGTATPEYGAEVVDKAGLGDRITFLNQIEPERAIEAYRHARLCVIPFEASFAGYAAGLAMANGAPVIATRRAGVPDHVGNAARFIEPKDVEGLARAITELYDDDAARAELAARGRARAEAELGWDTIAAKTVASYQHAVEARPHRAAAGKVADEEALQNR